MIILIKMINYLEQISFNNEVIELYKSQNNDKQYNQLQILFYLDIC